MIQKHRTSLTCAWQADNSQTVFMVHNFKIETDLSASAVGMDSAGKYNFTGKVEKDGRITLLRTYFNLPHVMPLCFQGKIDQYSSSIVGKVVNNGQMAGTFSFVPAFRYWSGYWEDSKQNTGPLDYTFEFQESQIYGFGVGVQDLYIIKGMYDSTSKKVNISEFKVDFPGKVFEGQLEIKENQRILVGEWRSSNGDKGIFELKEMAHGQQSLPPIEVID